MDAGQELIKHLERVVLAIASWVLKHWLLLITLAAAVCALLPIAAPALMFTGHSRLGGLVYLLFRPLCHQLPERSFFLFGDQWTYTAAQLAERLGRVPPLRYVGDAAIGYKVAVCQRDVAIYGGMLLTLLVLGPFVRRLALWPNWVLLLCAAPMAIDGGGQLIGLWQSVPLCRVLTGLAFAVGLVGWALPRLCSAMRSAQEAARDW